MVHNLSDRDSLVKVFMNELRSTQIQKDSMRFRKNLERLGQIIGYEISKSLAYKSVDIETPLGTSFSSELATQPVLATILRAGLPLHQGVLDMFDAAENAFISAYRKHHASGEFEIRLEYISCPDLNNKVLIVCDPMLATGASILKTILALREFGQPTHIHIVAAVASVEGIDYLERNLDNYTVWTGAIDEELTAKGYIVPGLGDAGDLAYGKKMQS